MYRILSGVIIIAITFYSCVNNVSSNNEMVGLISAISKREFKSENPFCPKAQSAFYDSILSNNRPGSKPAEVIYFKAASLLQLGEEQEAIVLLEGLLKQMDPKDLYHLKMIRRELAIAYLRQGERTNCIRNHRAASCIFPIQGNGVHTDKIAAARAIAMFQLLLKTDTSDLESRWLINIAYMAFGTYPGEVPAPYLIKGLDANTALLVKPFTDVAVNTGLNTKNQAGGSIVDDFNNDGYLDIITSSWDLTEGMHYCSNNGDGTFTDVSVLSGLQKFTGGLNMMQTDYNNDGFKDIFILRGAWKGEYGNEPNSLLRNNGDGTFTDVTKKSGLLSFHPTQTATWNDFNNDGWLDVFIGNESSSGMGDQHICELYLNNRNGTFTNIAVNSNTNIIAFVKGVTSGDYDNDGWVDIFISTMADKKVLLKNEGNRNGGIHFKDVTQEAGLSSCVARTFPTWFWDYDNDGWLDIFVCSYDFNKSLAWYAAAEALKRPVGNGGKQYLFRNKHDGSFEDVTDQVGLNKIAFAMGSNFGDIDNDGYSDIYLGTGNPQYQSLVPNKLFKNIAGNSFADVTSSAKVGNLQKGHGVSFCDLDNDGDEDIYIDMGGAYSGDAYENSLYINPGQNNNGWINLNLEGTISNRAAIGAKIKVTFREHGVVRSVYRDVNSGGSFGANPLVQHIGIGQADAIDSVEIKWPASHVMQVFKNIKPGDYLKIKEGNKLFTSRLLKKLDYTGQGTNKIGCSPN